MKFLPNKIFVYQLYILQLEEYDTKRFTKALLRKGLFPNKNLRKTLLWTTKAKILAAVTLTIQTLLAFAIAYLINAFIINNLVALLVIFVVVFYLLIIISFTFLSQSTELISPFEYIAKQRIIKQAKERLAKLEHLEIIGITGSYGKTTMKEIVSTILKENFKVVKTKGNNNTPIGIARTILNDLNSKTEIFIVEMGEYVKGDVKALCQIAQPDISIITGINEAHLERYGSMENAISTKFEIVEYARKDATILLNADDKLTIEHYQEFIGNKFFNFFTSRKSKLTEYKVKDVNFFQDGSGQSFEIYTDNFTLGTVKVDLLGEYAIGNIMAATIIAKFLGMNDTQIRLGISQIKPIEHRLQARMNANNILVIDDTYNGNSDGVREGISVLKKFESRRKVYVTPGLVETGSLEQEIHYDIGKQLSEVADLVILIRNSVTGYISQGLKDSGFKDENIIWYENSKTALEKLFTNLKPDDVVLMQNDWSDNYS